MKPYSIAGAIALSLLVAACGESRTSAPDSQAAEDTAADPAQTYSASGDVTALAGDRVTIAHGPVEGLGWPAMTMTFQATDPTVLQGIRVGDRVAFEFRQSGDDYVLASLGKAP